VETPAAAHDAQSFALRGSAGPVVLDPRGVHHPLTARGGRTFTPYDEIVHLTLSQRALWIGTSKTVAMLPRRAFVDATAPEALARALIERISQQPGSRAQLARMAEIEDRARGTRPSYATWGLVALCVATFVAQIFFPVDLEMIGSMMPTLVAAGEPWRLVTGNLLHASIVHLALNVIAVLAFGTLCERPLGTARTLAVMGVSGLAAMTASALAGDEMVVGVSGVASGLVGAVTWLEHFRTQELPSWWRVPRRPLYLMLGLTALLGLVPGIAGAAHLGGFFAGVLSAWLLVDGPLGSRPAPIPVRALAACVLLATAASVGTAATELRTPGRSCVRLLPQLKLSRQVSVMALNNCAWTVAIAESATPQDLESALGLAERAVEETQRKEPTMLDTLAELQFRMGKTEDAVATIDEAIAIDPAEPYYTEQRKRFLGERKDRPPPPGPFQRLIPLKPEEPPEDPGVTA
jgi:membrane associated rhomboid family serine protease